MSHRSHVLTASLLLLTLSGCAGVASSPGAAGRELQMLQQGQEEMADSLQEMEDSLLLMESRLQDQERMIEELRATFVAQKVTPAGENPVLSQAPPPPSAGPAAAPGAASPTETYLQAFSDYASGRYSQAIAGFSTFLQLFPGNDYASNAQYWLGECYYAQKQYPEAVDAFRRVAENWPQAEKAPEALFKMASALHEMGQPERAQDVLQNLQQRYPHSAAARKELPGE